MAVTYSYGVKPTYVKIASQTLASNSNVLFTNLPQNYTDLVVVCSNVKCTAGTPSLSLALGNNGAVDTGNNFSQTTVEGTGSGTYSSMQTNLISIQHAYSIGLNTNGNGAVVIWNIQNYSNPNVNKTVLFKQGTPDGSAAGTGYGVGLWRSTSPVDTVAVRVEGQNMTTGSTVTVYGIDSTKSPKATGGLITTDGAYWYHTFLYSSMFNPKQSLTADVLVVAGGGAGSTEYGGGGGAGGVSYQSGRVITNSAIVTVGAGGLSMSTPPSNGNNGNNSVFDTITSIGGGGGAAWTGVGVSGLNGGSGGGGSMGTSSGNTTSGGTGTQGNSGGATGYGNSGGGGYRGSGANYQGGGGGGAGAVGGTASSGAAGAGGNGLSGVTIATLNAIGSATGTGQLYSGNYYYAGGGGGGSEGGTRGAAGIGGGGLGGLYNTTNDGSAGTPHTGGGGGAGAGNTGVGGNGGSGIVIVRYAV